LWDPTTGSPVGDPLTGHIGTVKAMAAVPLPDGRVLLATGSSDETVRLWDLGTRQQTQSVNISSVPSALAYLGADRLAVVIERTITVISLGIVINTPPDGSALSPRERNHPLRMPH
jgi:WD40 repeat protein